MIEQIAELPLTVNVVARERDLIERAVRADWWAGATEEQLEELRPLAPLMQCRQRRTGPIVRLDLEDLTLVKDFVEFGPRHERLTTSAYRQRVEAAVRGLAERHPALRRLRAGGTLSDAELSELAELLSREDPFVTEDLLRRIYDHRSARFVDFMRHILGLERLESWTETVTRAFDGFIARHNDFTSAQIRFLQTVRTFVLQTGRLGREDLINPPFTQFDPRGARGLFRNDDIEELLALTSELVA